MSDEEKPKFIDPDVQYEEENRVVFQDDRFGLMCLTPAGRLILLCDDDYYNTELTVEETRELFNKLKEVLDGLEVGK